MELVDSERDGIEAMRPADVRVYSVGISSFANAELEMAERNPRARIIATTMDPQGLASARKKLHGRPGGERIECRLEDVREPLPYADGSFDFIYARLVLHYLTRDGVLGALRELRRILRPGGRIYVVARSVNEWELEGQDVVHDETTDMTTYPVMDYATGAVASRTRRFYSVDSLRQTFLQAGFRVEWCKELEETLYKDFERTLPNPRPNTLVSLLGEKPHDD